VVVSAQEVYLPPVNPRLRNQAHLELGQQVGPPAPAPPPPPPPTPTLCANIQLSPRGGSVGSNCNGDPNLTVTFPPVHKQSISTSLP
jgi:hypothetical protein